MEIQEKFVFEAIGTSWEIEVTLKHQDKNKLLSEIKDRISEFDKNYSRFKKDSLVFQMFEKPGEYTMPPDFPPLFAVYEKLYKSTNGLFTPLIGNVMRDAGYNESYSFTKNTLKNPRPLSEVLTYSDNMLTLKASEMLDFGAGGKGYIIDIVGNLLYQNGVTNYCIDAGGDILKKGSTLRIGLENPEDTKQVIGVVALQNKCICGSAGNRRKWSDFHHIINPESLTSPKNILAVWVVADTALVADAMSTALFLDPSPKVAETYSCEFLILFRDYSVQKSSNFNAELFLKERGV